MKLKEYLEDLNAMVKNKPEALGYEIITATDDEGNGFNPVNYVATVGTYDGDDFETSEPSTYNAVCLN